MNFFNYLKLLEADAPLGSASNLSSSPGGMAPPMGGAMPPMGASLGGGMPPSMPPPTDPGMAPAKKINIQKELMIGDFKKEQLKRAKKYVWDMLEKKYSKKGENKPN